MYARALHVDAHEEPGRLGALENLAQVVDRAGLVDVEAELRELQREVAFDAGLDDRVDRPSGTARVAASASSRLVTLSPSRSSVSSKPRASTARAASIASCDGFAGDEPPREARRPAHAVPGGERFQGSASGEQLEKGFRRAIEHQCVRPGVASRCSIVRA